MTDNGYFISAAFHQIHAKKYIIIAQLDHMWQLQRMGTPGSPHYSENLHILGPCLGTNSRTMECSRTMKLT